METISSSEKRSVVSIFDNALILRQCDNFRMPTRIHHTNNRRPAHVYLREWLEFRALTAEQLAGRLDTSKSVVSKLLNGKQRYNQDWLERIAYALNCEVPDLYRDPHAPTRDELLQRATPEQLQQIIDFADYLINKTGTDSK